jgi:DNA-binding GntR family transcriptional regulator
MVFQQKKTKKDQVIEMLREAVLSGELEPGEKLQQDKLAERFSVSSTPVREALRQLEAEGLVNHHPGRGVRVAEVDLRDVREIYLIRGALEALATRLAVPYLNNTYIQRLEALQAQMETVIANRQLKKLRKLNYEFHMQIYRVADMPQLFQIIQNLWTKFPWDTLHVLPDRAGHASQEHDRLIHAIVDGNAKLAGQLMQEHIDSGAAALAEYLQTNQPD